MATQKVTDQVSPIIVIDLGRKKKKKIKKLKRSKGELVDEVQHATDIIKARMGKDALGKIIVPVVLVYEKKNKKCRPSLPFPFSILSQ